LGPRTILTLSATSQKLPLLNASSLQTFIHLSKNEIIRKCLSLELLEGERWELVPSMYGHDYNDGSLAEVATTGPKLNPKPYPVPKLVGF
jgi:hypothetical protein